MPAVGSVTPNAYSSSPRRARAGLLQVFRAMPDDWRQRKDVEVDGRGAAGARARTTDRVQRKPASNTPGQAPRTRDDRAQPTSSGEGAHELPRIGRVAVTPAPVVKAEAIGQRQRLAPDRFLQL